MNRKGKRGAVVVTGASSGIGKACALHLDSKGFRVFAGVRKQPDADALKQRASDQLTPILIDVTDVSSVARAAEAVASALNDEGLFALVNNAGISLSGPLEFIPLDQLRTQLETNVIGQVAVTQAFMPLLRRGRGRVINIGSESGILSVPLGGPYCASKFAMEALTDSLRMELRPWGISVSMVAPGFVATPIIDKDRDNWSEIKQRLPQEARKLYDPSINSANRFVDKIRRFESSPDSVAKTVGKALTAKRPKRRYIAGRGARIYPIFARHTPVPLRDWILMKMLGIHKED